MKLEVLRAMPRDRDTGDRTRPPLLFVHGAFAGAWCWAEFFLPWFAARGWDCRALSLRGHGDSEGVERLDSFRLRDYAEDVTTVLDGMDAPPVLIGHSMGGMVVQKVLEDRETTGDVAGAVLMASVPPRGLLDGAMVMASQQPNLFWMILQIQTTGRSARGLRPVEDALFHTPPTPEDGARYAALLQGESLSVINDMTWADVPRRPLRALPLLVMGAEEDAFVPPSQVRATAAHHGVEPHLFPNIGHAMMMDLGWESVAEALQEWLVTTYMHDDK
ncbi:MAG: alpha/beta hydrolase [Rhodospirillum sp.]|nr:alpha/beta hydrolase [Rhodospirillum sp.]MCF8491864.1 alpha/beta hydrolase [Rhodospirillum sp.]